MEPTPRRVRDDELLSHLGWVRALAGRLVFDEHVADDVLQQVCLLALDRAPEGAREGPGLRAWLAAVTRGLAGRARRTEARRRRREELAARPEALPGAGDVAASRDELRRLVRAVDELDDGDYELILERYFQGRSIASIAERRGLSPAAARQRLLRARRRLRARLVDVVGSDERRWASLLLPATLARAARIAPSSSAPATLSGGLVMAKSSTGGVLAKLCAALLLAILLVASAAWWQDAGGASPVASGPGGPPEGGAARPVAASDDDATRSEAPVRAASAVERIDAPAPAPCRFVLPSGERAQALTGTVVDATGEPVDGAAVALLDAGVGLGQATGIQSLCREEPVPSERLAEGRTGRDGRFELRVAESRTGVHRHALPGSKEGSLCLPVLRVVHAGHAVLARTVAAGAGDLTDMGTLVLADGAGVRGRVLLASGRPAAGARVFLESRPSGEAFGTLERRALNAALGTVTDSDGAFLATGLSASQVHLEIDLPGHVVLRPGPLDLGAGELVDLGPLEIPDGAPLVGTVRDAQGEPVPGAAVSLLEAAFLRQTVSAHTTTDAEGRFAFAGLPEAVEQTLEVVVPGRAAHLRKVNVPSDQTVDVRLDDEHRLVFTVLGPDANPVPQGEVEVADGARRLARIAIRDGVADVPDGARRTLIVRAPGCAAWVGSAAEMGAADAPSVQLAREARVRGVVHDAEGRGSPGLAVRAEPATEAARAVGLVPVVVSDEQGRFSFEGLGEGGFYVRAERPGLLPAAVGVTLAPGDVQDVALELQAGGAVSGRVVREHGEAVPAAVVRAGPVTAPGPHALADGEGRFLLEGLRPGPTPIGPPDGRGMRVVEVVAGTVAEVEVVVATPARLDGRVTSGGRPASGQRVSARRAPAGAGGTFHAVTDVDGRFDLGELEPGALQLEVLGPDGRSLHAEDVVLGAAEARHLEIELPTAALRVTVRDLVSGEAIPGASVLVAVPSRLPTRRYAADADGRMDLAYVGEDVLRVKGLAPGHLPAEALVTLPPGVETAVVLELPRGGTLRGVVRIADAGTRPALTVAAVGPPRPSEPARPMGLAAFGHAPDAAQGDTRYASVARDGSFVVDQLPPGTWRVAVSQRRGNEMVELDATTVRVGVEAPVDVELSVVPYREP